MTVKDTQAHPHIPAAPHWLGNAIIYRLLIRLPLWNSFDRVWLHIAGKVPDPHAGAVVCYLNHPSWWDGYMIAILNRLVLRRGSRHFVMMEEPQLREFRFFTWAGAFSVHRHAPREAARSIAYASTLLQRNPRSALYLFPQGTITPNDQRPLRLYSGVAHIAQRVPSCTLLPIALRYEFRGEQRPEIFIWIGHPHTIHHLPPNTSTKELTNDMATRLTTSVDALRDAVVANDMHQFCQLLRGAQSINRVFDTKNG